MKNNKQEPVQVMLSYNAHSSEKNNLRAKIVTVNKTENNLPQFDDNYKLVRRYSIDDNGGGYLGL